MDLDTIKALIDSMAGSSRPEAECREGAWTLKLTRALPPSATQSQAELSEAAEHGSVKVTSPLYGIVHLQPSPDAPKARRASSRVSDKASFNSASCATIRMPLPPPPPAALMMTG